MNGQKYRFCMIGKNNVAVVQPVMLFAHKMLF